MNSQSPLFHLIASFPARLLAQVLIVASLALVSLDIGSAKPTLWIIGDSTVRNGTENQEGWGDSLGAHFDTSKIEVVNRAIGGRSSRSFLTEGRWDAILSLLKPGDYVLIQFGHNDGGERFKGNRPRASIKGNGDESDEGIVEATGKQEVVRSFGWYLRNYANDATEKGATPIILSAIPRNIWKEGKIGRNNHDYGLWAQQAAEQAKAHFIPFNSILADACDAIGPEKTAEFFAGTDHTHTNQAGADFNAARLAEAIRNLHDCDLGKALLPELLWLPSIFSDHMVLQRDTPIPIWGTATPGSEVTATLADQSVSVHANEQGKWKLEVPALPAGGPYTLEVSSGKTLTYSDILVGEVWLCSGQSNMDFTVAPTEKRHFAGTANWETEVSAATHPRIRMFTAEWTMHESPKSDVEGTWEVCSPETAGDFSAVAYFFGRKLQQELDLPIGLITCAYGASTAESWISRERLVSDPQLKDLVTVFDRKRIAFRDNPAIMDNYGKSMAKWRDDAEARKRQGKPPTRAPKHPDPVQDQHNPCVLFNGMIAPITPYGIRGVIWYQGESNVGTRKLYPAIQSTLIKDWRSHWSHGELPFFFVQLANYQAPKNDPSESSWASMREAQASSLKLPNTGMAVTIDIGEENDIHPRNKQDVGHRLARLALADVYQNAIVARGPRFREHTIENGNIRLYFDHADGGLISRNGSLKGFAIAGNDRRFVWAQATIDGETVVVRSPETPNPAYVRYAWADNPASANLFNSEMLPAAPFRTDP